MNIDILVSEQFGSALVLGGHIDELSRNDEIIYISYNPDDRYLTIITDDGETRCSFPLGIENPDDLTKHQTIRILWENDDGVFKTAYSSLLIKPRNKNLPAQKSTPGAIKKIFVESVTYSQALHRDKASTFKKNGKKSIPLLECTGRYIADALGHTDTEKSAETDIDSNIYTTPQNTCISYSEILENTDATTNHTHHTQQTSTDPHKKGDAKGKNKLKKALEKGFDPTHDLNKEKTITPMTFFAKSPEGEALRKKKKSDEAQAIIDMDVDALTAPITSMIGLAPLKEEIRSLINLAQTKALRSINDMNDVPLAMHMIFTGSPGTGKTTTAREIAKIMHQLGYLEKGHLIETTVHDMWEQGTSKVIEKAIGGVLFIDEAYKLYDERYDREVYPAHVLLKKMEDHRDELIVILAGYRKEMTHLMNVNAGIASRFPIQIDFPDYTAKEMVQIYKKFCTDNQYIIKPDTLKHLEHHFLNTHKSVETNKFGNGRGVRNLFEKTVLRHSSRIMQNKLRHPDDLKLITYPDIFSNEQPDYLSSTNKLDKLLEPLKNMTGLENIKTDIIDMVHLIEAKHLRMAANLQTPPIVLHSLFMGSPGTGKTTVARLLGHILKELGVLTKGHVVEVDRGKLTGKFVGWSEKIAAEKFHEAEGGILFIDEAYNLINSKIGNTDSFAEQSLNTILKLMEDKRDNVMVICAGYEKEMQDFIKSNSGVASRFPRHFTFQSYTADEMISIFKKICSDNQYKPTADACKKLKSYLEKISKDDLNKEGNGRFIRNIFEKTIVAQSKRITSGDSPAKDLITITADDIQLPDIKPKGGMGFI